MATAQRPYCVQENASSNIIPIIIPNLFKTVQGPHRSPEQSYPTWIWMTN